MLASRPIQIMAVEWGGPVKGEKSCKTDEKKGDSEGSKGLGGNNGTDGDDDWKFLYNVEIWHKRCIKKSLRKGGEGSNAVGKGLLQIPAQGGVIGENGYGRSQGQVGGDVKSLSPSITPFRHPFPSLSTPVTRAPSPVRVRSVSYSDKYGEIPPSLGKKVRSSSENFVSHPLSAVEEQEQPVHINGSYNKNIFPAGSGIPFSRSSPATSPKSPESSLPISRPKLGIFRRKSESITFAESVDIIKDSPSESAPVSPYREKEKGKVGLFEKPVSLVKKKLTLLSRGKN